MKRLFLQVCAHVEADGRARAGALAAAFVRTHVEAYGRTFTGTPYLQTDGGARPHVQWCVADGAVRPDVPADAAAHGEPDDRARPGSHVSRQCRQSNARVPSTIAPSTI